jgi:ABC-type glycerol-3-phosphate transport system substrate-binding protein
MRTTLVCASSAVLLSILAAGCSAAPGDAVGSSTDDLTIHTLRGVDSAGAFSPSAARTLKDHHDVRWTGVYIGGACDGGFGWNRGSVEAISDATGWTFLPIYVGQQSGAICGATNLTYHQGAVDAGDTAARMRAFGWEAHRRIPVTLDVEQATFEGDRGGAIEYVRGWAEAVTDEGYLPYVYANPDAVNAFASAHVGLAAAWVASWFFSGFASVTPNDLHQIGHNFSHHDRAWQYAGNVDVPGVGQVDCDTSDLLLAPAPGGHN